MEKPNSGNSHISPQASNKEKKKDRNKGGGGRRLRNLLLSCEMAVRLKKKATNKRTQLFVDFVRNERIHISHINNNQFSITKCQFIARINRRYLFDRAVRVVNVAAGPQIN